MTQVNGREKMENRDLGVKVAVPRAPTTSLLFQTKYSDSNFFFFLLGSKFHTTFNNTLSCTSYFNQLGIIYRPPQGHLIFPFKMSITLQFNKQFLMAFFFVFIKMFNSSNSPSLIINFKKQNKNYLNDFFFLNLNKKK